MFFKGLAFGLGLFIAKDIVQNKIPFIARLFTNGCCTNLSKKCESGKIKTLSDVIDYVGTYDPKEAENESKNIIGF